MMGPQANMLEDGKRLHLHHGPIDLIIGADGPARALAQAYETCQSVFKPLLNNLASDIKRLRQPAGEDYIRFDDPVARRMMQAVFPHRDQFVTPMAAVAGAVADHMLHAITDHLQITRAYVNNGGDIALYLDNGESFTIGIVADVAKPGIIARIEIASTDRIGGIATSGWRGRSHSLGIADAVTVLARTAAQADVAATLIANAIDLSGSKKIWREPATRLSPDSDLGDRLVTTLVKKLNPNEKAKALQAGAGLAKRMQARGLITAAFLSLQDQIRIIEPADGAIKLLSGEQAGKAGHTEVLYA